MKHSMSWNIICRKKVANVASQTVPSATVQSGLGGEQAGCHHMLLQCICFWHYLTAGGRLALRRSDKSIRTNLSVCERLINVGIPVYIANMTTRGDPFNM